MNTSLSADAPDAARPTSAPRTVDNTDWLKTAAIILATVDHFGYFFMEDDRWWSVFGRLAAPVFFFLLGYGQTRTIPFRWIWLGVFLTLLDSWNHDWTWAAPNILLSLALARLARPHVQILLQRHAWIAFILLASALIAVLPIAAKIVDYGAEGWLWALFGLCQRMYVDDRNADTRTMPRPANAIAKNSALLRLLAGLLAAVVYVWQEQVEFSFPRIHFSVFVLGVGILSAGLCLFLRSPSRIQPPEAISRVLRFVGRHTLELYAIPLVGFELIEKLAPQFGPR